MLKFKISASDFELLMKYYNKKCKGSDLTVYQDSRQTLLKMDLTANTSDPVTIEFFDETTNMVPKLTKKVGLGDEL